MGRYPFGSVLREAELAAEFGVSRTPIREALQRLRTDGLVEKIVLLSLIPGWIKKRYGDETLADGK